MFQAGDFPEELESTDIVPQQRGMAISRNVRQYYWFSGGGDRVDLSRAVMSPEGQWYHYKTTAFRTSFRITAAAPRNGDKELFVAGIGPDGVDVVERWTFRDRVGGIGLRSTSGAGPIGTPLPPYSAEQQRFGELFAPPLGEPPIPAPTREVVVRGDLGHVRSLEADPEGRFLLYQSHETHALMRLALGVPGAVPEVVFDVSTVPHLASTKTLKVMRSDTVGRRYFLTEQPRQGPMPAASSYTMIDDANNDGILDSPVTMLRSTYKQSALAQEDWLSFYVVGVEGLGF